MISTIAIVVVVLALLFAGVYIVPQQQMFIIERFGKFNRVSNAGIHVRIPLVERIAARMDMRILQLDNKINTKTKDNVFVDLNVAVQYRVNLHKVSQAYYELSDPATQIRSYVEDSIRNSIPTLSLDEAFEQKDQIATDVRSLLEHEMDSFGYIIVKTLITDIAPDQAVVNAMNSINEASRRRVAAQELAEADKITIVVRAQAEAEEARLRGEGIAAQRMAIIDGLAESVQQLKAQGLTEQEVMSVVLTNQYIDTLNGFAQSDSAKVLLIPGDPNGANQVRKAIIEGIELVK